MEKDLIERIESALSSQCRGVLSYEQALNLVRIEIAKEREAQEAMPVMRAQMEAQDTVQGVTKDTTEELLGNLVYIESPPGVGLTGQYIVIGVSRACLQVVSTLGGNLSKGILSIPLVGKYACKIIDVEQNDDYIINFLNNLCDWSEAQCGEITLDIVVLVKTIVNTINTVHGTNVKYPWVSDEPEMGAITKGTKEDSPMLVTIGDFTLSTIDEIVIDHPSLVISSDSLNGQVVIRSI